MGEWSYYVALMKMRDFGERVILAKEIYESEKLNELLQRKALPKRAKEISDYLIKNNQRFFSAITIGVWGGHPQWYELGVNSKTLGEQVEPFPISDQGVIGYLKLSGEELLFPIDGQHRLLGTRETLKQGVLPDFGDEEVPVIFIGHERDEQSKVRIRRLFTNLNRYAKPVDLSDIIALDEDDIAAICTREVIEQHELFKGDRLSLSKGRSIPVSDSTSFTNIVTLYKCNSMLLQQHLGLYVPRRWTEYRKKRPDQTIVEEATAFVLSVWTAYMNGISSVKEYSEQELTKINASPYRNATGGSASFRPIGLMICFRVLHHLLKEGKTVDQSVELLGRLSQSLNDVPWRNIIWEPAQRRMNVRDINQKVQFRLIWYMLGMDLSKLKYTQRRLQDDYASLLNQPVEEANLPAPLM
jgi:DNA sulfur modification protein DndB